MTLPARHWPWAIVHVDMNAFFASVEQRYFPELRGKVVGVTNGDVCTTLITMQAGQLYAGLRVEVRPDDFGQRVTRLRVGRAQLK